MKKKSLSYICMGGVFSMRSILLLIISFLCGYLFISWLPIPEPLNLSNFILGFVFNPVKVFAAAISFFVGFISTGLILRDLFVYFRKTRNNKVNNLLNMVNLLVFILGTYLLFKLGFWHMILLFSFAFLYGMMTMDKNK